MIRVYLEVGARRTFAMALDWPGWGRSGRTGDDALAALAAYAPRYAAVAGRDLTDLTTGVDVVETVQGNATTDFGAPAAFVATDAAPVPAAAAARTAELVRACWVALDRVAAGSPAQLRKGPRGGGRDRDRMLTHVIETEAAYARKIGLRHRPPTLGDTAAIGAMRADILAVIGGTDAVSAAWPVPYAARRIAWHALDHAWEMEDRA